MVTPLDADGVRQALVPLRQQGVEAIAICFLHASTNPVHEHRAQELVRAPWPEVYVCPSCDVLAEFREFERFATATVAFSPGFRTDVERLGRVC